jgi:hypothetical protein
MLPRQSAACAVLGPLMCPAKMSIKRKEYEVNNLVSEWLVVDSWINYPGLDISSTFRNILEIAFPAR